MPKHDKTTTSHTKRRVSPIINRELRDIELSRAVYRLAYELSRRLDLGPSEWREFLLFLSWFVEELGVDTEHLESVADLNALEFGGAEEAPLDAEEEADAFEKRWNDWGRKRLCRKPFQFSGGYVDKRTRHWFITTATVLRAAFPEIVCRKPRWSSHRVYYAFAKIKLAWSEEKKRKK